MIQKKLFMIWFGDNIPDFAKFSLDTFQQVNPDFKCEIVHRKIKEIEDIFYVEDPQKLPEMDRIINFNFHIKYKAILKTKRRIPLCCFAKDSLCIHLIRRFGGIFVDCDMFPVKPFDKKLLSLKYFNSKRLFLYNGKGTIVREGNFCGNEKGYKSEEPTTIGYIREVLKTKELQSKFYNCTLKYGERYDKNNEDNYVEHYGAFSWNPNECHVQKTKMDDEIEKEVHLGINFV
jgi:mannosyltransferase OCH1-like enzyme